MQNLVPAARRAGYFLCLLAVVIAMSTGHAQSRSDQPLPRDPVNVYGQFDNGLKYIIRKNANPPGKVAFYLHVNSGALNETDKQNGLAHFLEHMAFNGSTNFKPGELIPLMNQLGMVFGADSNAHTNLWETVYKLTMPDTNPQTIELALTIFSDYANGLLLSDEEINEERGVILEEARTRKSARERLQKREMKEVYADTRLSKHDVIGDEEIIKNAPRDEFVDYWNTWYRPENMTLIVCGDIDPDHVIAKAKEKLGSFEARGPRRQALKAGLRPLSDAKAFVFTDPEQVGCSIDATSFRPGRPPVQTFAQYRTEMVENIGQWIVNRRISDLIRRGGAPMRFGNVDTSDFLNEVESSSFRAAGEPEDWNKMLDALIVEISRAIDHGFASRELELARTSMISGAERALETESTRDSTQIVAQLSGAVGRQRPIMSAQQRLELMQQILSSVTVEEVHRAFVEAFKTKNWNYVVNLPQSKEGLQIPTGEDVLAAANAAWAKRPAPIEEQQAAVALLAVEPDPGKVVSKETDEDLQVTTVEFANGVLMHHKFSDYRKDAVNVRITLPGGSIEEDAETKGLSDLASLILSRPATSRLTSTQIRDLMTGKKVSVRGNIGLDAMSINVSGSNKDLPAGLQLAYAILTDGTLEQSAIDDWKKMQLQALEQLNIRVEGKLRDAIEQTIYGGDIRFVKLTPDLVGSLERAPAEAWFKRIASNAAIEVGVVGDIALEDAIIHVSRYIGSLPKRTNDFRSLDALRTLDRKSGPYEQTVRMTSVTPKAIVIAGFISCNERDPERRLLTLASLVLSDRMIKRIREKERLVYSIGCSNSPARGMPGTGLMVAQSTADPQNAERLGAVIVEMLKEFAENGPTEEELSIAKKQIANQLQTQMKEPNFWMTNLSDIVYRGRPLSDLKQLPDIYQTFTTDQVRDAVRKYLKDDSIVRFVVIPETELVPATVPTAAAPALSR